MKNSKEIFVAYDSFVAENSDWIIYLDPGHGGIINGLYDTAPEKMFDHGDYIFYEGVFNRAVALHLSRLLLKENISHVFTTDSNYDVSLPLRTNRINNYIRKYPDKKFLCVSIHGNAFRDTKVKGIETYSYSKNKKSDFYRDIIHKSITEIGWKDRGVKKANFHMLREPNCPSVLVELGFYSNMEEADEMSKDSVQATLAEFLCNGIKEIINE